MPDIDHLRQRLLDEQANLRRRLADHQQAGSVVELDQTRVGRLSRMDAMQQQAMAKAELARAQQQLRKIARTLGRLDAEDFGFCIDCDEPISDARLMANPTVVLCLDCAELRASGR